MATVTRFAFILSLSLWVLLADARAQEPRLNSINITAEAGRVRATAQGEVFELRMEVLDDAGEIIFEGLRQAEEGPLDWDMRDAKGVSVSPGTYTVTVSYTTAAGRPRKRVEQVTVTEEVKTAASEPVVGVGKSSGSEPTAQSPSPTPQAVGTITGEGAAGKIAKFTGTNSIGNSIITESASKIGIGVSPTAKLDVAGAINSSMQYNLSGKRVLSTPGTGNLFVGPDTGTSNTPESPNTFSGENNTFAGFEAGYKNTSGYSNTFAGSRAGKGNTTGYDNSFYGAAAGVNNSTGKENAFFGRSAGLLTTIGSQNSFFGFQTGFYNSSGVANAFFGWKAGYQNTKGDSNSFFGFEAGFKNTTGYHDTFVGRAAGFSNSSGFSNTFVGAFTSFLNTTGSYNTSLGSFAGPGSGGLTHATAIGAEALVYTSNTVVLGRGNGSDTVHVPGKLRLVTLGGAGATALCRNASNELSACSSSLRYKSMVRPFAGGLTLITRLRPIAFAWKADGAPDIGLGAEEVAAIEPRLVTLDEQGQVEGVKYDRLSAVFINAFREQQAQIQEQQRLIERQARRNEEQARLIAQQGRRIGWLEVHLNQLRRAVRRQRSGSK